MPRRKPAADPDPRWSSTLEPAPGDLRIVQAFLNTASLTEGTDFAGPRALADFLELWGLMEPGTRLEDRDLERAVAVRWALRALLVARDGTAVPEAAVARLDAAMAASPLRLRFAADGRTRLEPTAGGLDAALARLCAIVAVAQNADTWPYMRICFGENCRAAYFDFSRNRLKKWCSPRCSSRSSSLAYRRRNLESVRLKDRGNAAARRLNRGLSLSSR